jgi:amino acid transporter
MTTTLPGARAPRAQQVVRSLGLFSVLCIGVNAIVGSGIYRLPGRLGHHLGPASWIAFALVGVMLITVGLCFAEAAGMFEATGGPCVYAREAFGMPVGFGVGWMAWVTSVTSWGAVANAIPGYLAKFVPAVGEGGAPKMVVLVVIAGLGIINFIGVRPGAFTTNVFTVAKLVPLLVFVGAGLAFVSWHNVALLPPTAALHAPSENGNLSAALGAAMFAALFPLQGFESAPVPAGETTNPRRNVPIAVVGSLFGCTLFYVLIQLVAYGVHPEIATSALGTKPAEPWSTRPLAEAAATFLGDKGGTFLALGAVISMVGYCSGAALVAPRYLQALAADRMLAPPLARLHARFGSPYLAVAITTGCTLLAGLTLDFDKLVDLSNVAVIFQYAATCAAVTRLRYSRPDQPRTTRVPGGPWLIPMIGIGVCVLLASQASWVEFAFSGATVALGAVLAVTTRRMRP